MSTQSRPGELTTEHAGMKKTQFWIKTGAGLLLTLVTALLASGVIPPDSSWAGVLGMVVTVLGAAGFKASVQNNYNNGRSRVKVAEAKAANQDTA